MRSSAALQKNSATQVKRKKKKKGKAESRPSTPPVTLSNSSCSTASPSPQGINAQQAVQHKQHPCALKGATLQTAVPSRTLPPLQPVELIVDSSMHMHAAFVRYSNWRFSCRRAVRVELGKPVRGGVCRKGEYPGLIQEVVHQDHLVGSSNSRQYPNSQKISHFSAKTELLGIYEALSAFLRACRTASIEQQLKEGCRMVVFNDNTSAVAKATALMNGRGATASDCPLHAALATLKNSYGVPIEFRYLPRLSKEVMVADAMSRWQQFEWQLNQDVLAVAVEACLKALPVDFPGQRSVWPPDIDLFASERTHLQQCEFYYATMWDRRCAAANAWALDWSKWPEEALCAQLQVFGVSPSSSVRELSTGNDEKVATARKPVCYAFPPLKHAYHAMRKIESELATVWLVLKQELSTSEALMLKRLPVKASVLLQPFAPVVMTPCDSAKHVSRVQRQMRESALVLHFIAWDDCLHIQK